ncbi:MAG: plasmid pRiA4b ORF-3 family protein [Methanobrevibacter sp.]|jgi:hypothetical protein|nr:plasmid pRiA4b ORF-3 family protein [Candidatus Methanovirga meridionalis]
MKNQIAVIRIKLLDAPVPIWRRIQEDPDITLDKFHEVIQIVMGWGNYHLYGFHAKKKFYSETTDDGMMDHAISSDSITLKEIIDSTKKFRYEYDFGDGWEHEITFNKYIEPVEDVKYPCCVSGKGLCPPEDIGGVWGYGELLEEAQSPNPSDEFLETAEHYGYTVDDLKEIEKKPLNISSINELLEYLVKENYKLDQF